MREIEKLLWSIGDAFDEMDHTGRDTWGRIGEIEKRVTELAAGLSNEGETGEIKRKIQETRFLHNWWGSIVDMIEDLKGEE